MFENEIWKEIEGFENYQISNLGRVKSKERIDAAGRHRKEKILKPSLRTDGYLRITLYDANKKPHRFYLHRKVLETFNPVENMENLQANHLDENKQNCCLSNLNWLTAKENCNYGTHNERCVAKSRKRVRCIETGAEYCSASEAARQLGCDSSGLAKACRGVCKTYYGYHWEYID